MNRRDFLQKTGGAALGASVFPHISVASNPQGSRKLQDIGLQLYTVRNLMQDDFEGTIEKVASIGYTQLEFAGYYNRTPQQVRALLDRLNVSSPANHTQYNDLRDNLDKTIEGAKIIGQEYVVLPMLPMNWSGQRQQSESATPAQESADAASQGQRQRQRGPQFSRDDVLKHAEFLNSVGEACAKADLRFAYHNHSFEFAEIEENKPMYDFLLEQTDPDVVDMELDLYWIVKAGADPFVYFDKFPGHFKLCHVKGMSDDDEERMTPVGPGKIDFAKIFAASEKAGLKYYLVEHDQPEDALVSIMESYNYLKKLSF